MLTRIGRIGLLLMLPLLNGCAILMSAQIPEERPPSGLRAGLTRYYVDKHYGYPIAATEPGTDGNWEKICFVDGLSYEARHTRQVVHLSLDVCTYYIWEIIGTPFELCALAIGYPEYIYYLKWDRDGKLVEAINGDDEGGKKLSKSLKWTWTLPAGHPVEKSNEVRNNVVDSILKLDDTEDDLTANNRHIVQVDNADNEQPNKKAYEIKYIKREGDNDFVYSFEVDLSDCDLAIMRTARKEVRETIYADYKEELMDSKPDFDGRFVRVIVQWNQEGSSLKGRARVVFPKVTKLEYVSVTRKINVELEFDEAMQAEVVRAFAKKTAENLARDKNVVVKAGETPEEAPYMSLDERIGVKTGVWKFAVE